MNPNNFVSLSQKHIRRFTISTHDGPFQIEEVLACSIIVVAFYEDCAINIMRTSDPIEAVQETDIQINIDFFTDTCYSSVEEVWETFSKSVYSKLINKSIGNFEYYPHIEDFSFISSFIPPWNSVSKYDYDKYFVEAVETTCLILKHSILQAFAVYKADEDIRYRIDCDGSIAHEETYFSNGILQIANEMEPWLESVLKYNSTAKENFVNFVIFLNYTGWTAQCVPISLEDNTPRIPFPEKLIGLDSKNLSEILGVDGILCSVNDECSARAETKDAIYSLCFKTTFELI